MKIETVTTQPIIEAKRFTLRPMQRSDVGLVEHYCSDERVANGSRNIPHPFPPGAADALIDRALSPSRTEDIWVMDGSGHGQSEVLGLIALSALDRDQSEITYWVAPAYWKTGLATEAVRAMLKANPQNAKQMFAAVFQDHPGTARVLTNCGFDYLGDAEEYCLARQSVVPTWTYSMTLTE